jgi:hypothetical protein
MTKMSVRVLETPSLLVGIRRLVANRLSPNDLRMLSANDYETFNTDGAFDVISWRLVNSEDIEIMHQHLCWVDFCDRSRPAAQEPSVPAN